MENKEPRYAPLGSPLAILGSIGLFGCGALFLLGQVVTYLDKGVWVPKSLLENIAPDFLWLRNPDSWFGLHKIVCATLNFLGISGAYFIASFALLCFGLWLSARENDKRETKRIAEEWQRRKTAR